MDNKSADFMDKNLKHKLEQFFQKFTLLSFKKGEMILRAGDTPAGIFYLKKGLVRQYILSKRGEILVIHIFRPGSFFMMMWAINNTPNTYHFDALTPVDVWRAPLSDVRDFIKKEPELLFDLTSRLLTGLEGLLKRFEYLVLDPAYAKVASLLSYFAKTFGEKNGDGIEIKLPITHKEIASWIGTTRETASLQIEDFKRRGLITNKGRTLVVKDLFKLEQAAFTDTQNTSIPPIVN